MAAMSESGEASEHDTTDGQRTLNDGNREC